VAGDQGQAGNDAESGPGPVDPGLLDETRAQQPHHADEEQGRDSRRPMFGPPQSQRRHGERDRTESEAPLRFVTEQRSEAQRCDRAGKQGGREAVHRARCTGERPQPVDDLAALARCRHHSRTSYTQFGCKSNAFAKLIAIDRHLPLCCTRTLQMVRTRVTILAGFLGAGKTTLLNALLRDATEPLGVIVNDFGSVNVDAALVAGQSNVEGEIALQNGCICCTIRGDLLSALLSLARREDAPRHVVIECSGVSDPAGVARTFIDPRLSDLVELAAAVACIDPLTFPTLVGEDWSLASKQLAVCDFAVFTRADCTTDAQRIAARELVRTLNPRTRLVESSLEQVPSALVLGTPVLWDHARAVGTEPVFDPPHVHEAGHHPHHHHHEHEGHAYETWTYRSDETFSTYALRRALARLPPEVFRAKGFVYATEDRSARLLVHVVGPRAEMRVEGTWGDTQPKTELVFLGRDKSLPVDDLKTLLDSCRFDGQPSTETFMEDMLGYFNRLLNGMPGLPPTD